MINTLSNQEQTFLRDIGRIQNRQARANEQVTSGYRISRASDDPSIVARLVQDHADLSSTGQTLSNLQEVKSQTDTAEQAIQAAVKLLDNALQTGAQGATDTVSASTRQTLADQVQAILTSLVSVANTRSNGRYLFSGDKDQTAAYSLDFTQANPVSAYGGSASTRQIADTSGQNLNVSLTAQTIFDSSTPANNVLQSLVALRAGLAANNSAAINTALSNVKSSADFVNQKLAVYGGYQNSLQSSIDSAQRLKTNLTGQVSALEDTDLVEASLELSSSGISLQAALAAEGKKNRKSLFDYIG